MRLVSTSHSSAQLSKCIVMIDFFFFFFALVEKQCRQFFQLNLTYVLVPGSKLTWMALLSMVVFIASYSIGIGPIAWLLVGEIFPLRSRGKAAGFSTAFNLFLIFLITSLFSSMLVSGEIFSTIKLIFILFEQQKLTIN